MTQSQYNFYKAEAELPGITAEFSKMSIGALLRKEPVLTLPDGTPDDITNWLLNEFGEDGSPLAAFLEVALEEDLQTSRAWVFVDYPVVTDENLTREEKQEYRPFPKLFKAESVINWRTRKSKKGQLILDQIIIRGMTKEYKENAFHPTYRDTVWVHELDNEGLYKIRVFRRQDKATSVAVAAGQEVHDNMKLEFKEEETIETVTVNGRRLDFIPAWPLNGNIDVTPPIMNSVIDKEISLYNKMSRRNHLLYGAATYTPIIASDMSEEAFDEIVNSGLGTWIHLGRDESATILDTPTAALADMDRAIVQSIEEIAKLGIRMLTPEVDQSGIALEIRNAPQTAKLGSLNNKVSNTLRQIIKFMIYWRYEIDIPIEQIEFSLSSDWRLMLRTLFHSCAAVV